MMALRIVPVVLSSLVLGAHFYRAGYTPLAVAAALFPLLLLFRNLWCLRAVQVFLFFGAAEWIRTILTIADVRQAMGRPWIRMAAILGAVAFITLVSGLLLGARRVREHYTRPLHVAEA